MHLTSFLPVAFLSTISFTSAYSLTLRAANPALVWQASNFTTGCSPGGCTYRFNIAANGTQNTPGFNTSCNGTDVQNDYAYCLDKNVSALVTPASLYPLWNVSVKHSWTKDGGAYFFAEGQANVTSPMKNFTINVTEVYGVA